ncbi:MAG: phosphoglycolate phosphatase, partial [Candidatus Saccharimonadales bacterium]
WEHAAPALADKLDRMLLITLEASSLAAPVAASIDTFVAVGQEAERAVDQFASLRGLPAPGAPSRRDADEALVWRVHGSDPAFAMQIARGSAARRRHLRKYAEGDLGDDRSFYFRGPELKLNLKAQNLSLFAQLAEGIDAETWLHHLRRHDYSNWFRSGIKDPALADEAATIEANQDLDADQSRATIIELVRERYTAPATQARAASRSVAS